MPLAWNDAEGRLISVDSGTTATYVYTALGERVEKDVGGTYTEYVFDKDGNPLGENNRTSWTDTWVDFQGMHIAHYENGETYFMHSNRIGTVAFVTDYSGAVVQDELHYPWGEEWAAQGTLTEERFAGLHHRDPETDPDPTPFRMYSPAQYSWFTPDPLQADIFNPQSMSAYTYATGIRRPFLIPRGCKRATTAGARSSTPWRSEAATVHQRGRGGGKRGGWSGPFRRGSFPFRSARGQSGLRGSNSVFGWRAHG